MKDDILRIGGVLKDEVHTGKVAPKVGSIEGHGNVDSGAVALLHPDRYGRLGPLETLAAPLLLPHCRL